MSPPTIGHARLGEPLVELEHVVELASRPAAASVTTSALRLGARGREVAQVDRGGAVAEVAPGDPVEPEVDALDERVLRDDEPAGELRRVVLDPLREAAPLQLGEQAELAELARASSTASRSVGRRRARTTATPAAPAAMHSRRVRRVDPADRDDRDVDRLADRGEAVEPDRRIGVRLRRRRPDRARADVGRARRSPRCASSTLDAEIPSIGPRRRARSAPVAAAEVDAVGPERERRLDVVVDDEGRAGSVAEAAGRRLDDLRVGASLSRSWMTVAPPSTARARGLEVLDDRVQPHSSTFARASSVSGSSAYSAS